MRPGNLKGSMDDKRKTQWKLPAALQDKTASQTTENKGSRFWKNSQYSAKSGTEQDVSGKEATLL